MDNLEFISLITVIQSPDKFDGKAIRVVGLCTFRFEGKAMWVSGEALEKAITKNAVWLDIPLTEKLRAENRKVMIVEGVFSAQNKGHLGLYSGSIEQIARVDRWEK
jgi:hypothetical protein